MSDPFADYGRQATSPMPAPLLGPIKRRADARLRYSELVEGLYACTSNVALDAYLESIRKEVVQFAAELEFLWSGNEDFLGLAKEIEWARARVDPGLDFPRWEAGPDPHDVLS